MDLTTRYLGLSLTHPFIAGASPLADSLDAARRLEDGGAAAIVLHSLFEEQITMETRGRIRQRDPLDPEFADALSPYPGQDHYALAPDEYLEHIRRLKDSLAVPIIASLNGTARGEWMRYASRLQEAGADGLEVNFYDVVADPSRTAMAVETELRNVVLELKEALTIPIAMKLSPSFTALGNLAARLDTAGCDGLVLFNRFYQPDVDLLTMTLATHLQLSTPAELPLRLQWAALLRGRVKASIAISGGVAGPDDGVKALLAGADAVQVVSAVLRQGPGVLGALRSGLTAFMEQRGIVTLDGLRGRASLSATSDTGAFERAHYIRTLQSWRHREAPPNS